MANLGAELMGALFSFVVLVSLIGAFILNPLNHLVGAGVVDLTLVVSAIVLVVHGFVADRIGLWIIAAFILMLFVLNHYVMGGAI